MIAAPVIDLARPETFPSRRVESWKYTDLHRILREAPAESGPAAVQGFGPYGDLGRETIAFANGRSVGVRDFIASGSQTLRLRFVSDAEGTGHTASARIVARPGARLLLLESHEGHGSAYVAHNRVEIDVAEDAEVTRIVLVDEPEDAISVCNADVNLQPGGRYYQTILSTGARLQRLETRLSQGAKGADARLDAAYVLKGARHTDMTTVVDHLAENGTTSQLTKGVVHDNGRGVFQGKIVVERGADGTDARMGHHALIASDRGEVDAKPELIIYADDVQCAHGNTVGTLDESALFYMQQRGIPLEEARGLLAQAFLMEVVERIGNEPAREVVREWLTAKL